MKQFSIHICLVWALLLGVAFPGLSLAQGDPLVQARSAAEQKNYSGALKLYESLYEQNPLDESVYNEYFLTLMNDKQFKEAEKLAERQLKVKPANATIYLDLGSALLASGKEKKANEQFDKAVQAVNGDDILTTRLATAFTALHQDQYAIRVYERAVEIIRNPYFYSTPLARLYAKTGDIDKAVTTILSVGPMQMPGVEDTKTALLELLGNDPKKLQLAQKVLIRRVNEQPENSWYAEMLTWLYTQKDDWEGALIQIQALDERNQENGARLLEFARTARKENRFDIAVKALDAVLERGKEQPMYVVARAEKLNVLIQQLENNPAFKQQDVILLSKEYDQFFVEFPQYYNTETLRDYALLEAQYAGNVDKAIGLLQSALQRPGARREFSGWTKLQLGDYQLLKGQVWDASLSYSQVDKDFREDMLGEEARFRNAKLAYYGGDFEWAQGQLSVLKASTSELIANDALYLSVLITENIPPDSNLEPLKRYAYADLLLFQNKDKQAEQLLDSITAAYPKHPLNDDILMLRSRMAVKHREYEKALSYLQEVFEKYNKDVLADDAVFRTAEIYEQYLKQPQKAKEFYEKLILDFPGSTYVQTARVKLSEMQNSPPTLP